MSRRIRSFRDLKVYQLALHQSGIVFDRSCAFPKQENFALTSQIRRSSRAVSALIAEAWARHQYPRAFRNTISQALGEVCETQAWLDHAYQHGYISQDEFKEMNDEWQQVWAMLYTAMKRR